MNNRREFLAGCAQIALVAGTGLASTHWLLRHHPVRALEQISLPEFQSAVGSTFSVRRASNDSMRLQLVEAKLAPAHFATRNSPESFSLLFRNLESTVLSQDIHSFEHATLGRFDLFIVPVNRGKDSARCYEAVFNRPTPNPSV